MEPTGTLITKYLPADYADSFAKTITDKPYLSAKELFDQIFLQHPKWVKSLLNLRDRLVKPLGLKTNKSFEEMIIEQNNHEIILGTRDKHLSFYVSVFCPEPDNATQTISITTLVKYENLLGKIYFAAIWLFHRTIVYCLLKRCVKRHQAPRS